jgi:hypothetical protein
LFTVFYTLQPIPRAIANKNKKFDKNITKRGTVTLGKTPEEKKKDELPVSKWLIAFFLVVVVGSSVVQVLNMFMNSGNKPPPPPTE